ncbi:pre-rRNA-processing protein esf1-like [Zingiber officinale]|uniref:pre-rRNA-processing protein esf1-like n=1 Tax=Zingiber officinale TaxID=94328 RepID=UPI001C4B7166|nr:pre-rRNA-processing protein esf1-like [Zingiber officinale]
MKNGAGEKKRKKKEQRLQASSSSMPPTGKQRKNGNAKNGTNNKRTTDSRFASVHYDPRFQRMPKRESKVEIDSRFTHMFSDKKFEASDAPVDKRGKRKKKSVNPLLHYYLNQEEDGEQQKQREPVKEGSDGIDSETDVSAEQAVKSSDVDDEEELNRSDFSSHEDSSSEDEDTEDDDRSVNSDIWKYLLASHEDTPIIDNETNRLAVVNMDWDHIKAVDLYVVMSSCLPKGGQVLSVSIYPSEFGLKCMEIEAVSGPFALIDSGNSDEDDSDIDNEKLRTYELNKLRYYYAVVILDSVATASHIYNNLDGTEFLESSNVFDLRFIPNSMDFKQPPQDIAKEASAGYNGPDFQTRALQHSKVKLTWEEDKPERKKLLRGKFNPDQLDELNEYLASSGDSDYENDSIDEENDHLAASSPSKLKKRKRVHEDRAAALKSGDASDEENSNDEEMEITFSTELEDLGKRLLEKKDRKSETVWETVLKKKSEKRKARRNRCKHSEDDSSDYDTKEDAPNMSDDFFMEEPNDSETIKTSKKKTKAEPKKKRSRHDKVDDEGSLRDIKKEQEVSRAELELLLADDQGSNRGPKGYNMKRTKVKGKKGKEVALEDKIPDIDVSKDPRFSALSTSHLYALDPTNPEYKRSATYVKQKIRKQKGAVCMDTQQDDNVVEPDVRPTVSVPDEKNELLSTIRSLKRNVGTLREQSKRR